MGVIAKGIPRGCQGLSTPVSLGYLLSVFNKNSTLKATHTRTSACKRVSDYQYYSTFTPLLQFCPVDVSAAHGTSSPQVYRNQTYHTHTTDLLNHDPPPQLRRTPSPNGFPLQY